MKIIGVIILLLLSVRVSFGQSAKSDIQNCCTSKFLSERNNRLSLQQLGYEFKRLRSIHCEDCNKSRSDYYEIMVRLGEELNGASKAQIKRIMGKPDRKDGNKLIYYWRGMHDYLFFEFIDNNAKAQWYYAYE